MRKIAYILLVLLLAFGLFVSCSDDDDDDLTEADIAAELFDDLDGSYVELFPVIFDSAWEDTWMEYITEILAGTSYEGYEQALYEYYVFFMSGSVIGEEAVEAYAADYNSTAFNCDFQNDIAVLTFDSDNMTITGIDTDGERAFSNKYYYYGMSELTGSTSSRYIFATDAEDAGEFKYFSMSDNTTESSYHIEFSYGSDLDALATWYSGAYAYWCAAGIASDYDDDMVKAVIKLFCEENFSYYASL